MSGDTACHVEISGADSDADLLRIARLAPAVWRCAGDGMPSRERISHMLETMYDPLVLRSERDSGARFRLIRYDGSPGGFIACSETGGGDGPPDTLKLDRFGLVPELRGRGIGSLALAYMVNCASDAGYRRVTLNVDRHNVKARRFCLRNGFKIRRGEVNSGGGGFAPDDLVMLRIL